MAEPTTSPSVTQPISAIGDVLRFVRTDKDYVGLDKTLNTDLRWVYTYLGFEPEGLAEGHVGEPVMLNGSVVGSTSSVAYGPTVGKVLARSVWVNRFKPCSAYRRTSKQGIGC